MSRPFSAENAFRAMGHRTRRRVLELLCGRNRFASDLVDGSSRRGLSTLSEHLRILRESGLVSCRRRGTRLEYTLNADALSRAVAWLATLQKRAAPRR